MRKWRVPMAKMLRGLLLSVTLISSACSYGSAPSSPTITDPTPTPVINDPQPVTPITVSPRTPTPTTPPTPTMRPTPQAIPTTEPTPAPFATPSPIPQRVFLEPMTHEYQTWNNCAPVSSPMVLSYFRIQRNQHQLAPLLRPHPGDKHVEPGQVVTLFEQFGLRAQVIEGGSIDLIKRLLAAGLPVITPQWLDHKPDAIGHYRVVRGYDDTIAIVLVNDSMVGAGVPMPYSEFEELWQAFNFHLIVVSRPEDEPVVLTLLGEDADPQRNLERAHHRIQMLVEQSPNDAYLWFSLGTSEYLLGNVEAAIAAYERAAAIGLPPKMLWYQFWPVSAYVDAGRYDEALQLAAEQIASAGTFAEMRYERGRVFEATGQLSAAIAEYRRALDEDSHLDRARAALVRLGIQP